MDLRDSNTNEAQQEYTIIRIKRKRDDEVPDVLVVDKKGMKRRKSGLDVFQFAETVDEAAWKEIEQDELRKRISALSKLGTRTSQKHSLDADSSNSDMISRQTSTQTNASARQYRVVTRETRPDRRPSRFHPTPPKVLSSKDVDKASSKFRIYDAELASPEINTEVDPEMEKFQSLLKDYMKVDDNTAGSTTKEVSKDASMRNSSALADPSSSTSGDYVYDIFYHRPSTLSEQAVAANMATIIGLPPTFDEDDDLDSDSEVEDEADEDSNAEDFYRNDYPDEESSDSDECEGSDFHSEDDFGDSGRFEPGC